MKKRKMWKYTLPLAGISLITASVMIGQTVINNNLSKQISFNNTKSESNDQFINEINDEESININEEKNDLDSEISTYNENTRASSNIYLHNKNDIPELNNNINWKDYLHGLNGKDAQKYSRVFATPEWEVNKIIRDILLEKRNTSDIDYDGANVLNFMYRNRNLDSMYGTRVNRFLDYFNHWDSTGSYALSYKKSFFPESDTYYYKVQGVKFNIKKIDSNPTKNWPSGYRKNDNYFKYGVYNYRCTATLAYQIKWTVKNHEYNSKWAVDVPFYLDYDDETLHSFDKVQSYIQSKVKYDGFPEKSYYFNDWIKEKLPKVTFFPEINYPAEDFIWFQLRLYSTPSNPYKLIVRNSFPLWKTTNQGEVSVPGLTIDNADSSTNNLFVEGDLKITIGDTFPNHFLDVSTLGLGWSALTAQELADKWKQNKKDKLFVDFTNKFNNSFHEDWGYFTQKILCNCPLSSNNKIELLDISRYRDNEIAVKYKVSYAFQSNSIVKNKTFTDYWNGFRFDLPSNDLAITSMSYTDTLFKNIFASPYYSKITFSKGFFSDFYYDKSWQFDFHRYLCNHKSTFITNVDDHVSIGGGVDHSFSNPYATVLFSYMGIKNQHFNSEIKGSIRIKLRSDPTPSDFSSIGSYIQKNVNNNNKVPPTNKQLQQWVVDYLNQSNIKNNIPDCVINFVDRPDNIIIDSSKISNSSSSINFQEGAIKTKSTSFNPIPVLTMPSFSISVKSTTVVSSISATNPINVYKAPEILGIWNYNHNDDVINILKTWINDHKTSIFSDLPAGAYITSINSISRGSNDNSLSVTVTLSSAYTSQGLINNKQFTFSITNFQSGSIIATTQKLTTINYNDAIFKTIFGSSNRGFIIDFEKNLSQNTSKLETYIKANIDTVFNTNGLKTIKLTSAINFSKTSNDVMTAKFDYRGFNSNRDFINNNHGTITINLKPNPIADDFTSFNQFLQTKIDQNEGLFPTDEQLKQWASEYLNQPENQAKLPDAVGSITANSIIIDPSKIDKSTLPITFKEGAIKTNTNPSIIFPSLNINAKNTTVKASVIASKPISDIYVNEILSKWNNGDKNASAISNIYAWISQQKNEIFIDLPEDATITLKDIQSVNGNDTSLNITITVSKAYTLDQGIVFNKDFTFEITNFNSTPITATEITKTTISYTELEFKEIFTNCTNGYTVDFNKDIEAEQIQLKDYMNANLANFFNNVTGIDIYISNVVITVDTSTNSATATITYSGFDANNTYNENNQGIINIALRPTPGTDTSPEANNPLVSIEKFLQDKVQQENNGIFPTNEQLKQWISDYLNQAEIKDNLPKDCIPSSNKFTPSDINVDPSKIDKSHNPIEIQPGAITTTNANIPLTFPGANITVKVTEMKNNGVIDVSNSPINNITVNQFINAQDDANSDVMKNINSYLNSVKKEIFIDLPEDATISVVPGSVSIGSDGALNLKIKVSNANTLNGIERDKQFDASISGLSEQWRADTTLKITEINYSVIKDQALFKNIWANDKGYAIDWACLSSKQIDEKQTQLMNYMNDNISTFFKNPILETKTLPTKVFKTSFNLSEININIVKITISFNGIRDNREVKDISEVIDLKLQAIDGPNSDMDKIIGQNGIIKEEIQNWVDNNPGKQPTPDELADIVNNALNKPVSPDDPNGQKYKDLIPNEYEPTITPEDIINDKIHINGDKVTIDEGAIQFKPKPSIPQELPNWGKVDSIINPEFGPLQPTKVGVNDEQTQSNWWIWVVIVGSAAIVIILIVLIISFIIKSRKQEE